MPSPPSEMRQWIWGFHFKSLPKVCRTQIKPGVKDSDWFILWNRRRKVARTASKRRLSKWRSFRKKERSWESMVKTQWRCWTLMSLKAIAFVRSMEYLVPQEGHNLHLHRNGTNLSLPHFSQPYIAPPKDESPQWIIFSIFSITMGRGLITYWMYS